MIIVITNTCTGDTVGPFWTDVLPRKGDTICNLPENDRGYLPTVVCARLFPTPEYVAWYFGGEKYSHPKPNAIIEVRYGD